MTMAKARYYKADGKKGRARDLPAALFDGVVNEGVLHQVVKAYLSNQRQGTASGKNRSAVRGGGRKPWKQKGTGRARQGTIRAPQWTGGGLAFPPQPHGWRVTVPKKVRGLARRSALNARAEADRVVLIDPIAFEGPKTRQLLDYLAGIEVAGKVLILTYGVNENLVLSARNVPGIEVMPFGEESSYDILSAGTILIERPAIEAWEQANAGAPGNGAAPEKAEDEAEETTDA
jgi:large subunit ribosomal protein L4